MIPKEYKTFIDNLFQLTEAGKIKWVKYDENSFYFVKEDAKISVSYYLNEDEETAYYTMRFISRLDNVTDGFRISQYDDDFSLMEKVFGLASRSSQNISTKLSNLISNIKTNPSKYFLEKLKPGQARVLTLENGDKINAGVIRVEGSLLVFYTGKGLREMFKPDMSDEEKKKAEELKKLSEEALTKDKYISTLQISQIVDVEP
jgi:hypothetical protein